MANRVGIPVSLQNDDFRFIKILARKKVPFEKAWQENNNYTWRDPRLQEHLDNGGNYGVVCGYGGLVVIDADKREVERAVRESLLETFTVRTGGGGRHFYYICKDLDKPIRLKEEEAGDLGDVQYTGKQVVGPNSIHPNGKKYEVEKNLPIREISAEELRFALKDFLEDESAGVVKEESEALEKHGISDEIPITDVVPLGGLKRRGEEFQGPHPIHGSAGGRNFTMNPGKNVWHCFRHDTGGKSLFWLAVQEEIIECGDAVPGALRGDKFTRVLEKAKERGLISDESLSRAKGTLYFENGRFVPKRLAEEIMSDYNFITLEDTEEIYVYRGGIFRPLGETVVKSEAQARLGERSTSHCVNEAVTFIRHATYAPRDKFDRHPYRLVLENGALDVKTHELEPHSPDPPSTVKIPVEYDPDAECPKIRNFLEEVLKEKDIPTIQEFVGYCLLKDHRFHKAAMLTGGGANGKSTFLNLVRELLGRDNVASASLQDLIYNRFAKADLYGKMANVHSDISDRALRQTGAFKMLTGEDLIYAEKKHRDAFHFENFGKLLFSANEIPESEDKTRAFFLRWLIVEFPYKFTSEPDDGNKDKDPRMLEKITTGEELSGFLNWALEGLERLLENEEFSDELTVEERADIWEEMSDPIIAFKEAELVVDPGVYGTKDEIYNAYAGFCHAKNTPPLDKNVFSRELPKRFLVEVYRPKINGRQTRCWKGLGLKDNPRAVQDIQDIQGVLNNKGNYEKNYSSTSSRCSTDDIESIPDILDILDDHRKLADKILHHLKFHGGKTPKKIADRLSINLKNAEKILEALSSAGILERGQETIGGEKIYRLARDGKAGGKGAPDLEREIAQKLLRGGPKTAEEIRSELDTGDARFDGAWNSLAEKGTIVQRGGKWVHRENILGGNG